MTVDFLIDNFNPEEVSVLEKFQEGDRPRYKDCVWLGIFVENYFICS